MNQKSPNDPKSILILTMKLLLTFFWKRLPIGDLISLTLISLAFSKSSQIRPSSSNHLKTTRFSMTLSGGCIEFLKSIQCCAFSHKCARERAVKPNLCQNYLSRFGLFLSQGFQNKVITSGREALDRVEQTRHAAKTEAEKLGHNVSSLANYLEPLADAAIGLASKTVNSRHQQVILDQSKTVAESALQFMIAAKEGGGNPKATNTHGALDEQADGLKENLQVLIQNLEEAASSAGIVTSMVDSIAKAMAKVRNLEVHPSDPTMSGRLCSVVCVVSCTNFVVCASAAFYSHCSNSIFSI